MNTLVPVVKIQPAKYLIGTELKLLEIKSAMIMVRIGGGYEELTNFLQKHGTSQCLKL